MLGRLFQQQHRKRKGLLARGAARHPDPNGFFGPLGFEQFRDHILRDFLERLGIAEKRGHRDQQIAEQRLRLIGVVPHHLVILFQIVDVGDLHPPRDATQHSRAFVF